MKKVIWKGKMIVNIALIIAGGTGSRMGQDIPKQFIHVNNRPIVIYTLEIFQSHPEIDMIQVVCVDGWQTILRGYALQFNITKLNDIVLGGVTRYHSIYNGMHSFKKLQEDDVIIVHDAIRPLVPRETISDTIRVCKEKSNSMSVLTCADTMYLKTDEFYTNQNIDRNELVRGQTPEAVTYATMQEMYREAEQKNVRIDSITAMQVALGKKVHFSKGAEKNIKLTTTDDIELFKALLETQKDAWLK